MITVEFALIAVGVVVVTVILYSLLMSQLSSGTSQPRSSKINNKSSPKQLKRGTPKKNTTPVQTKKMKKQEEQLEALVEADVEIATKARGGMRADRAVAAPITLESYRSQQERPSNKIRQSTAVRESAQMSDAQRQKEKEEGFTLVQEAVRASRGSKKMSANGGQTSPKNGWTTTKDRSSGRHRAGETIFNDNDDVNAKLQKFFKKSGSRRSEEENVVRISTKSTNGAKGSTGTTIGAEIPLTTHASHPRGWNVSAE